MAFLCLPFNTINHAACVLIKDTNTRAIPKSNSDWLVKKYKRNNTTLLYGRVTYINALLLHIVAIHIEALVVP
jgi:hypothetical protein